MGHPGNYLKGDLPCSYCVRGRHSNCVKAEDCTCNCPRFVPMMKGMF